MLIISIDWDFISISPALPSVLISGTEVNITPPSLRRNLPVLILISPASPEDPKLSLEILLLLSRSAPITSINSACIVIFPPAVPGRPLPVKILLAFIFPPFRTRNMLVLVLILILILPGLPLP